MTRRTMEKLEKAQALLHEAIQELLAESYDATASRLTVAVQTVEGVAKTLRGKRG